MTLYLGLDIGTGGGRCSAIDESGRLAGAAARPWRYVAPEPAAAELDLDDAWESLVAVVREALAGLDPSRVAAVGVASQRTGVVLQDAAGATVYAGANADGRAVAHGIALEREHGEEIYSIARRLPAMLYLPARLAWLRAAHPDRAARVAHALAFSDWAVWRLCGERATEPTQAAEMGLFDVAAGAWSASLCRRLGVDARILPPVRAFGEAAGALSEAAAQALGVRAGIPVVAGGADTQAALLGAGVAAAGEAGVVAGTTMLCGQVSASADADATRRLWVSPHPAGRFVSEAHCGEAGAAADWLAMVMGEDPARFAALAQQGTPGAGGIVFVDSMPSVASDFPLVGPATLAAPAPLLALARPREDVARALYESIAFAAAEGLSWLAEHGGAPSDVAVCGGVARAPVFTRTLATALGRPVRVPRDAGATARGAAIAAAAAPLGGVNDAIAALADRGDPVEPDPSWADRVAGAYASWRERAPLVRAQRLTVGNAKRV